MNVVGLQMDITWEDPAANRAKVAACVREAAKKASDFNPGPCLLALPEMWPTGFTMRPDELAEGPGGPSERLLSELAAETGAAVCGSIPRTDPDWSRPRNVLTLAQPDGAVHHYAKIHPFNHGQEGQHYEGGDELIVVEHAGVRITPLVCYDLRFAELFTAAAPRTDLFVVVANWPTPRREHWRALLVARAIETQAYLLGVNRVGRGGGLEYSGDSLLVSPLGEVLADSDPGGEGVIAGIVDPSVVADVRASFPFLADRRDDLYRSFGS